MDMAVSHFLWRRLSDVDDLEVEVKRDTSERMVGRASDLSVQNLSDGEHRHLALISWVGSLKHHPRRQLPDNVLWEGLFRNGYIELRVTDAIAILGAHYDIKFGTDALAL
jgi:hypothetical protein